MKILLKARNFIRSRAVINILLLLILVGLATSVLWNARFPYTHDGENHLVRLVNYAAAIRDGQLPPRFAPYLLNGYGFPVFNYNYPLANILGVPFSLLGINPEITFRAEVVVALTLGAFSLQWLIRQTSWKKSQWFAVVLYLFAPYLTSAIWFRGNIGEIWAYALAPVLGAVLWKAKLNSSWLWQLAAILTITAVLLAHNLLGLMIAGLWLVISLVWGGWRKWRSWLLVWGFGTALSLWFWLPAVMELPLIVLQQDSLANKATDHLLSWWQILLSPLSFGFSQLGPLDNLGFGIGLTFLAVLMLALVKWVQIARQLFNSSKRKSYLPVIWSGLIIFTLFTLWLSSESSRWLWDLIQPMQILQFPWRWLFLSNLLLVVLSVVIYNWSPRWLRLFLWVLLVIQIWQVVNLKPADRFSRDYAAYLSSPSTTLTRNENRPTSLTQQVFDNWSPAPQIIEGEGEIISIRKWSGSNRRYSIRADSDVIITEPTVYFPGWQVKSGPYKIQIEPAINEGLTTYRLSARPDQPYIINSKFSETTLWRVLGDSISVMAVIIVAGKTFSQIKINKLSKLRKAIYG
jgi:uncharacterized membrane protein